MNQKRFAAVIQEIDAINMQDPNKETIEDTVFPKELLYSQRMTGILKEYEPNANELLIIAARGQHIKRWSIPREDYDRSKQGYHKWRHTLADLHASLLKEIMTKNGYTEEEVKKLENMILKKNLSADWDAQTLQDTVSLVFLRFYALDFIEKHGDKNVANILTKVLNKMSNKAIETAIKITPAAISDEIKKAKS